MRHVHFLPSGCCCRGPRVRIRSVRNTVGARGGVLRLVAAILESSWYAASAAVGGAFIWQVLLLDHLECPAISNEVKVAATQGVALPAPRTAANSDVIASVPWGRGASRWRFAGSCILKALLQRQGPPIARAGSCRWVTNACMMAARPSS